jgi:glycosyltransferase involved in cell wall biosynthesis
MLEALRGIYPDLEVWDIDLHGVSRLAAQARSFYPNMSSWRWRFYAHPATFAKRTAAFGKRLRKSGACVDAFLQIGVLYDASEAALHAPLVIYTDNATLVTAERGRAFRLPFSEEVIASRIAQERHALNGATHVCTRSRFIADVITSGYGVSRERMSVVGGGGNVLADPRRVYEAATDAAGGRFLFVGREFDRKGGDFVLRAFERVHAALPWTRLTMITGLKRPSPLPGVRWLTDLSSADLANEYASADVFVFAARFDTWGDVLVEAMSAELACICPDRPPFNEIVSDGITGCCVDVEDAGALSQVMLRLALDRAARTTLGKAARAAALANFSWDVVAAKLAIQIQKAGRNSVLSNIPSRSANHE